MGVLQKGIGTIKIEKMEDGRFKATANGIDPVINSTESGAILGIQKAMEEAVRLDESKQPFRIA